MYLFLPFGLCPHRPCILHVGGSAIQAHWHRQGQSFLHCRPENKTRTCSGDSHDHQKGLNHFNEAALQSKKQFTPFRSHAPKDSTSLDLIHYAQKSRTGYRRVTEALLVQKSWWISATVLNNMFREYDWLNLIQRKKGQKEKYIEITSFRQSLSLWSQETGVSFPWDQSLILSIRKQET